MNSFQVLITRNGKKYAAGEQQLGISVRKKGGQVQKKKKNHTTSQSYSRYMPNIHLKKKGRAAKNEKKTPPRLK